MQCDMCGKEGELYKAKVEGVEMNVCDRCSKFGKVVKKVNVEVAEAKKIFRREVKAEKEIVESVVEDCGVKIKKKREKMGLKQEELAQKIAEKESMVHKIESGKMMPSMKLAKKLERFLEIKLVEFEEEEESPIVPKGTGGGLTIGDMIKIKK